MIYQTFFLLSIRIIISNNLSIFTCPCLPAAPPEFVQWPQSVSRPTGGSAVFSCTATGVPEPHLIWLKNGKLLTPSGNVKLTNANTYDPAEKNYGF